MKHAPALKRAKKKKYCGVGIQRSLGPGQAFHLVAVGCLGALCLYLRAISAWRSLNKYITKCAEKA